MVVPPSSTYENNDFWFELIGRYLKSKIKPEESHRFHFFNSFFYRKLSDLDKDQSSEGKAALQRVLKWTKKVNVFEKDYIFIPVNYRWESVLHYFPFSLQDWRIILWFQLLNMNYFWILCSLHWSLIVICHPGEVANVKGMPFYDFDWCLVCSMVISNSVCFP